MIDSRKCEDLLPCHTKLRCHGKKHGTDADRGPILLCGLGGGNWNIILAMIEEILGTTHDVYIYEYNPEED